MNDIVPALRLRSEDLTPEGAFKMWRATLPQYTITLPAGETPASFFMDTSAWLLDPLVVTAGRTSSAYITRSPPRIPDGYDNFVFALFTAGSWHGEAEGRPFHLDAGEMIILDTSRQSSGLAADCNYVMVNVPRRTLAEILATIPDMHGHTFRSSAGCMFADHLAALARYMPRMDRSEVPRVTRATLSLMVAGLSELTDLNGVDDALMSPAIRLRVERYIERNLSRADLTPSKVSEELEIARSTLYRAFTPLGGVSAYILGRRLETARAILFHPEDHRPISEIADVLGFESTATFSKAFARRFGCSPREARSTGSTRLIMSGRILFEFWSNVLKAREDPQGLRRLESHEPPTAPSASA